MCGKEKKTKREKKRGGGKPLETLHGREQTEG